MKIVILGAGPGGYVAAVRAAQLGAEVTLIERDRLGGTCLNHGCIPSKILKKSADLIYDIEGAEEFGIRADARPLCSLPGVMSRKNAIIASQQKGIQALLQHNTVNTITGHGRLVGDHRLEYADERGQVQILDWDRLILATGSRPYSTPVLPLDGRHILSSNDALDLTRIPASMIIVGGGVIGCELACIFSAFGTQITIVEGLDRLLPLPSIDRDCSRLLLREMKKRKITVLLSRTVTAVDSRTDGLAVTIGPSPAATGLKEKEKRIVQEQAEKLLVCIGRRPNSDNLGLAGLGLAMDERGWIIVDEMMRTNLPDIYAIGDVLGPARVMLAHVASMEGEIAAENCLGAGKKMSYAVIPGAVFTRPEIGTVGLSEEEAGAHYHDARAETVLFRSTGKAHILGELAGEAKIIFRAESGKILGLHIAGPNASDLIAEGALAIQMGAALNDLATTVHAHPTLAEILREAALKAMGRPLHG
ncbi:MAG: dihydrolipoyl dehydrogenase [Desulfocapsaceae bacterium]|nr:dihydrolipoyl dehydrogenase [Desulfocapsaceae bacterium]